MPPLRFALLGTGFWSQFQLAAWNEVGGVECVALYNRTVEKAEQLAHRMGVPAVYSDACELLRKERLDFVDIVTSSDTHCSLVAMAAARRVAAICQKPMAASVEEAGRMVDVCRLNSSPLFIHENWRWQAPLRKLNQVIQSGAIGRPFRARLRMASAFRVFDNQPFLKELEQFLLVDMGSHILDVARFLFGEAASLYCLAQRVQPEIRGEDVATVVLKMQSGATVICEMGYAGAPLEEDHFPQTTAFVEGDLGSVELKPDYWLHITTASGTVRERCAPAQYPWADPAYAVVHASIVPCHANLVAALRGEQAAETTGEDNLKTMRLVHSAYESAQSGEAIKL